MVRYAAKTNWKMIIVEDLVIRRPGLVTGIRGSDSDALGADISYH